MVSADRARSRTFVVTGAASGIGLATAQRLLAEGGSVVGADGGQAVGYFLTVPGRRFSGGRID